MNKIKLKSSLNDRISIKSKLQKLIRNIFFFKSIIYLLLFTIFFNSYNYLTIWRDKNNRQTLYITKKPHNSKIIKENFFIIDSNNLDKVYSHMYGFSVSRKGILTNNYYKKLGYYEEPESQGVYIMIRKNGEEIRINQDFSGSYGLYIYKNKLSGYFAISNSFLLLEEYLIGKENIHLIKIFLKT